MGDLSFHAFGSCCAVWAYATDIRAASAQMTELRSEFDSFTFNIPGPEWFHRKPG